MTAKAFHELLNWYGLVDEGVVLCKDGSLLAGWYLEGVDTEPMDPEQLEGHTDTLARAIRDFEDQDGFWVDFARRPLRTYTTSERDFDIPALRVLEAERAAFFAAEGANYTNRITLCYHWMPPARLGRDHTDLLEAFAARCRLVEVRFGAAFRLERMGLRHDTNDHHGIERGRDALLGRLASGLSGRFCNINVPRIPVYLDRIFAPEWAHGWPFSLPVISGRPAAIIAVDGYPGESSPEMLAVLEMLAAEYQWTTRYLPLSPTTAEARIGTIARGWSFARSSLRSQFSEEERAPVSTFADAMAGEAGEARGLLEARDLSFGDFTSVLTIFGEPDTPQKALTEMATDVVEVLEREGFSARRESFNALEAFLSTLPGHRRENVRGGIVSAQSFTDLIPISTIWSGQPTNPSNKFPAGSPALLRGLSATGEPYFFNLHSGDVGHTMVFGPTGSGKSVLLGLIASNFLKYPNAQVFVFDRLRSMYTLTRAIGGTHIELGTEERALSPLSALPRLGLRWGLSWVEKLCHLGDCGMTPARRAEITAALKTLDPKSEKPFEELVAQLQDEAVRDALAAYATGGAFAGVVNAASDDLDLARFTVFEAAAMLDQGPKVSVPVLDYLFETIETRLTGAPTVIILDEAWSFLGHDLFQDRITQWLRELRKANCALVLATQFSGDALETGLSGPLIQSCKTRIFLADRDARNTRIAEAYRALGLTEAQIDILATIRPARDYYILKPEGRRIVDFCLGPKALRLLGATDIEDSTRTQALWEADPDHWWRDILKDSTP